MGYPHTIVAKVLEPLFSTCYSKRMSDLVRRHYESHPYPRYPLLASVPRHDTYALNLDAIWTRFNGCMLQPQDKSILVAGCGSFAPYPFALANPDAQTTALDLSRSNLRRARLHCLLHGLTTVTYLHDDLLDPKTAPGPFPLIDAYGVLHHLENPLDGFKALADRLTDGGILRIMVYSRYARREEDSIRRAFRLLGIRNAKSARKLLTKAPHDSRLGRFSRASHEIRSISGLADALLHPCVHSFRIHQLMDLVRKSGLRPLLFAHHGALPEIDDEVARIRAMEQRGEAPGNFVLFLGRNTRGACSDDSSDVLLQLNPCLRNSVGRCRFGALHITPRLGHPLPVIGAKERAFLRGFSNPIVRASLSGDLQQEADIYREALLLVQYRPQ